MEAASATHASGGYAHRGAPVAQWIEQRFPKPRALVRFRPGALSNFVRGFQTKVVVARDDQWDALRV
jgi:hypothetical protein